MRYTRIGFLCSSVVVLLVHLLFYPKWQNKQTEATLSWDVAGYYLYLTSFVIYNDARQVSFYPAIAEKYQPGDTQNHAFDHPSGNKVFKYAAGQAILLSPGFFIGHLAAHGLGYPADGYSFPYQLAISIWTIILSLMGLWLLTLSLRKYFSDQTTAITVFTIAAATNYLNYAAIDGAMTHNTLFTVYALLVYATIRFYENPKLKYALLIGASAGLATLTRPTEIISLILPVLWGISSLNKTVISDRVSFLWKENSLLLTAAIVFVSIGSIQLAYWKYASGEWLVYSYRDQGFSFLSPHFWKGIFSYQTGWLVYSPILLLAFPGFYLLYKKQNGIFLAVSLFCLAFTWLVFAWDDYLYGGGLGMRAMVQGYAVYAFALAAAIEKWNAASKARWILFGIIALFTYYNLWLTWQAHKGGLLAIAQMTRPYFWRVLFRYEVPEETKLLLDNPDLFDTIPPTAQKIYSNNFESDTLTTEGCPIPRIEGQRQVCLTAAIQYSPTYKFPIPKGKYRKLRVQAMFRRGDIEWDVWKQPQLSMKLFSGSAEVYQRGIRVSRLLYNTDTRKIWLDMKIRNSETDHAEIQLWNADSQKSIAMDNLEVFAW